MICDFCSSTEPRWEYPAESFFDAFGGESVGNWLACDECHRLIEVYDCDGLVERGAAMAYKKCGLGRDLTFAYVRSLYVEFFRHRTGLAMWLAA